MEIGERKKEILYTIIKEHIETALPISSGNLVGKYDLGISSATVRNEMAELEEQGYIYQPHTSAGRIPTEKAYSLYVSELELDEDYKEDYSKIDKTLKNLTEQDLKQTAKALTDISQCAVFWAFHKHNLYYTGISNLFHQPEFKHENQIYDISTVIDRMEEIIDNIFDDINGDINILVGSQNPFSSSCSVVMAKYRRGDHESLIGILGPMRMDYKKNIKLINYIKDKVNKK